MHNITLGAGHNDLPLTHRYRTLKSSHKSFCLLHFYVTYRLVLFHVTGAAKPVFLRDCGR